MRFASVLVRWCVCVLNERGRYSVERKNSKFWPVHIVSQFCDYSGAFEACRFTSQSDNTFKSKCHPKGINQAIVDWRDLV